MKVINSVGKIFDTLDYHRNHDETTIETYFVVPLTSINDAYFQPRKNLNTLWQYFKSVGLKNVAMKVVSRLKEAHRNEKYMSFGFGKVFASNKYTNSTYVLFLATFHPYAAERVVVSNDLIVDIKKEELYDKRYKPNNEITIASDICVNPNEILPLLNAKGWTRYSESLLEFEELRLHLRKFFSFLNDIDKKDTNHNIVKISPSKYCRNTCEIKNRNTTQSNNVVIFGYGQYVKTAIIPNIRKSLFVSKIHEIDPTQIINSLHHYNFDTSPIPTEGEHFAAYFIATYHSLHNDLAVFALKNKSYSVVEKPLATTRQQINELSQVLCDGNNKYFACFQKRYSSFNRFIKIDANLGNNSSIAYYCIVYEVPLPANHWYGWPSSRGSIVSNGCHWIDHFLFLNNYADIVTMDATRLRNGDVSCTIELCNLSQFSMILTTKGSGRIGVREHIEIRADDVSISIDDNSIYTSENKHRILNKIKVPKLASYKTMYTEIGKKIKSKSLGDSRKSILVSSSLPLELQERLLSKT